MAAISGTSDRVTLKREAKRALIVEAAMRVLMRDGLQACTARAVADESPLTKSAIHYYFDSIDEIVDAAMDAHLDRFLERLRVAEAHPDPAERFWLVTRDYLNAFSEEPGSAVVWFGYWLQNMERGRVEPNVGLQDRIAQVIVEILAEAGADDPQSRGRAVFDNLDRRRTAQEGGPGALR